MSQQTKVRFGPVVTSSMGGAFYPLPTRPPLDEVRGRKRRERHPAGDSSLNQNGANNSNATGAARIPPFRTGLPCDRPSPVRDVPSPGSSCKASPVNSCRASPLLERPSSSLDGSSPLHDSNRPSPNLDRPSPARESNRPSPTGSIPTIPEEEEPNSNSGSNSSNRRRRHSSGQRVVRRTRTRPHRPGFASTKVDVLGQMQIMCAVLIFIVELLLVTKFPLPDHFPGIGFVAGLCFLVSGGLGILSSCTRKHAQILLCMMTAIIATVVAAFVGVFATLGFIESLSYGDDDEEVLNQLFYMIQVVICSLEVIGALGQAAICCCATCCLDCKWRRKETQITVIYATCPTTGSGSLDDVKNGDDTDKEKVQKKADVDKSKSKDSVGKEDEKDDEAEGIENDGSTSGCETLMEDDDVLLSNEELNEFWVIPRVVRGGSSSHRGRSDSSSSKKRERRPSGSSGKQRHGSDSTDKRERNLSGNSAKSEKRRHSSTSSKSEKQKERHDSGLPETPVEINLPEPDFRTVIIEQKQKERHDSGYPETPVENFPLSDRTNTLGSLVLVDYGSDDTIVRSERSSEPSIRGSQHTVGSERNSVASNKNLVNTCAIAENSHENCNATPQSHCNSREDSVFVDLECLQLKSTVIHNSVTNSNSCLGLGDQKSGCEPTVVDTLDIKSSKIALELSCPPAPCPMRQDSNMSNVSDCPSGVSSQPRSSLPTSEEDNACTSESSGFKSMSRESSLENS